MIPNPGTQEAIDEGCICPVMDNEYGRGYMGIEGIFVHRLDCPVHTLEFESEKKMNLSENARLKDKIGKLEAENERLAEWSEIENSYAHLYLVTMRYIKDEWGEDKYWEVFEANLDYFDALTGGDDETE